MANDPLAPLVYIILFGGPMALVFCFVGCLTAWRPLTSMCAAIFTLAVVFCLVSFYVDEGVTIEISKPVNNGIVDDAWPVIEGTVSPPNARVVVLVHPDKHTHWWVQGAVQKGIGGAWRSTVNLGDSKVGRGTYFEIIAVASAAPWLVDAARGKWLEEGQRISRFPALPMSNVVAIWRRQ